VLDDRNIVFVDYIILVIAGCKNDGTSHSDTGTDEGWYENIFHIGKGSVDPAECCICHDLPLGLRFLGMGVHSVSVGILEEAYHLTFGLRVLCRDEFRC